MKLFVGVKALIKNEAGQILLIREAAYDEGINEGKWDVPGGRIKPEEPIFVGLEREVREEVGITIEPRELLGVFETFPVIKGESCHIVRVYFAAKALSTDIVLSEEHDEYEWVNPKNLGQKELVNNLVELLQKIV